MLGDAAGDLRGLGERFGARLLGFAAESLSGRFHRGGAFAAGGLRELAAKASMHDSVRDLLMLLSDRRRLRHLPEITESLDAMVEAKAGKVRAEVTSAAPLSDAYLAELAKALGATIGREVVIGQKTDPELIGGVVTRVGDRVFDGSLKHQLSELREELLR